MSIMEAVLHENTSSKSPFQTYSASRKKTQQERLALLDAAFERIYKDQPNIVSKGTRITKANVAIEAGLPVTVLCERNKYQHKLISKILFIQEIENLKPQKKASESSIKKTEKQKTILRNLYLAINRLLDDEPQIVPKGSAINQSNVSLEAGYRSTFITTRNPIFRPVCEDIKKARHEKEFLSSKHKMENKLVLSRNGKMISTDLRMAIDRLMKNKPQLYKGSIEISLKSVSIEAGYEPNFLKMNSGFYKSVINEIEKCEIERQKSVFLEAIDRLKANQPCRVPLHSKINCHTVAIEAGYPKAYLLNYCNHFADVNKIIDSKSSH